MPLGARRAPANLPASTWQFAVQLDQLPLVVAGLLGVVIAIVLVPRRVRVPLVLMLSGVVAFAGIGLSGASVINRYLLTPSVVLMLFGAVTIGGWSLLERGHWLRRVWIVAAVARGDLRPRRRRELAQLLQRALRARLPQRHARRAQRGAAQPDGAS